MKIRGKRWYEANKEKVLTQTAKWYADNKEKALEASALWRKNHPERAKAIAARYEKANPDSRRIRKHNRRSREATGKLSKDIVARLLKLQRGKCACCALPLEENYHLDHIMPLALGGLNIDSNMQLLRQHCNNKKAFKHPVDFMQQKGFLL